MSARSLTYLALAVLVLMVQSGCSAFAPCQTAACENDRKLSAEVLWQLNHRASFDPNSIRVQTYDGVVYLYGLVDTDFERVLAADIAMVPGVREVRNELAVRGSIY